MSGGYHGDPVQSMLGPHQDETGSWVVRALLPQASSGGVVLASGDDSLSDGAACRTTASAKCAWRTTPARYRLQPEAAARRLRGDGRPLTVSPPCSLTISISTCTPEGTNYRVLEHAWARTWWCHDGVAGVPLQRSGLRTPRWSAWRATSTSGIRHRHPMRRRDGGIWELFIPGVRAQGEVYKYFVRSPTPGGPAGLKCDPYGFCQRGASEAGQRWCGTSADYEWNDHALDGRTGQHQVAGAAGRAATKCIWNRG